MKKYIFASHDIRCAYYFPVEPNPSDPRSVLSKSSTSITSGVDIFWFKANFNLMTYFVYILSNKRHTVFYTGVTNDIENRVFDHKVKRNPGFTAQYNCDQLMYYEEFNNINDAIHREKQLKRYKRDWKKNLINGMNSEWKDLSEGWYDPREFELYEKLKQKP